MLRVCRGHPPETARDALDGRRGERHHQPALLCSQRPLRRLLGLSLNPNRARCLNSLRELTCTPIDSHLLSSPLGEISGLGVLAGFTGSTITNHLQMLIRVPLRAELGFRARPVVESVKDADRWFEEQGMLSGMG